MTTDQLKEITRAKEVLQLVVTGTKHGAYQQTIDKDAEVFALSTGKGLTDTLKRFDITETEREFKVRKQLTESIIPTVYQSLTDPQYKVPRSNNAVKVLSYTGENQKEQLTKLEGVLKLFDEKRSFDDWMGSRWIDINNEEPNKWVVLEWKAFDNTRELAKPYPFEVTAEQAVYFDKTDRELNCLVVKLKRKLTVNGEAKETDKYTYYGRLLTLNCYLYVDGETLPETAEKIIIDKVYYWIEVFRPHDLGFVPAFQPGFIRDKINAEVYTSTVQKVFPVLKKLLEADSQYDITQLMHVFPRQFRYDTKCTNKGCNKGRLPSGEKCPKCSGTGFENTSRTTNAGQSTVLPLPTDPAPDQIIDLAKLIFFANPPVDFIKYMEDHITKLKEECRQMLYGSEIFSRKAIAETATKSNIDIQSVYDTLYPLAIAWASDWEWGTTAIAKITALNTNLICSYKFGKDFKMKSLDELYADLQLVSTSGADNFIKSAIQDDIAGVIYSEDPHQRQKYFVMKQFFPFPGKTPEEILGIVTGGLTSRFNQILWANYESIFNKLEREQNEGQLFYEKDADVQWKLIVPEVEAIMKASEPPAPVLPLKVNTPAA